MSFTESVTAYFRTSKAELEKVTWPSKNDTIRYSSLVVAITIVTALFFAALDLGLVKTVEALLAKKAVPQNQVEIPVTPITEPSVGSPDVEAVTPSGAPADVQVETLPTNSNQ